MRSETQLQRPVDSLGGDGDPQRDADGQVVQQNADNTTQPGRLPRAHTERKHQAQQQHGQAQVRHAVTQLPRHRNRAGNATNQTVCAMWTVR